MEDTYPFHTCMRHLLINKCVLNHKKNFQEMLNNVYNEVMLSEQNAIKLEIKNKLNTIFRELL